MILHLH
jgi:hypothetical protein